MSEPVPQVFLTDNEAIMNAWAFNILKQADEITSDHDHGWRCGACDNRGYFDGKRVVVKSMARLTGGD